MKLFNFGVKKQQQEILVKILQTCNWFESDEALYTLRYADEPGFVGETARTQLKTLSLFICELLNLGQGFEYAIDLRRYRYPLYAYCAICNVLKEIEIERGLERNSLNKRIIVVTNFGNSEKELKVLVELQRAELEAKMKIEKTFHLNSFIEKLEQLFVPKF